MNEGRLLTPYIWDIELIADAVAAKVDLNGCFNEILQTAMEDAHLASAETQETLTELIQDYQEQSSDFMVFSLCPYAHSPMRPQLISEIEQVRFALQTQVRAAIIPAPKAYSQDLSCQDELNCMEKIIISQISADLAEVDKALAAGEISPEMAAHRADEIVSSRLADVGDSSRGKILKSLALTSLNNMAPPEEIETLAFMKNMAKSLAPQLEKMQAAADRCQESNVYVQESSNLRWPSSLSDVGHDLYAPAYQIYKLGEVLVGNLEEIDWAKHCLAFGDARIEYDSAVSKYLRDHPQLNSKMVHSPGTAQTQSRAQVVAKMFLDTADHLGQVLIAELEKTHSAVDQSRKVAMIGAGGVFVAGLSAAAIAASPLILPSLVAAGGTGTITSILAGTGTAANVTGLALNGAAITVFSEYLKPLVLVAAQDPNLRSSALCESFDRYYKASGMGLVLSAPQGGIVTAAMGGPIGAMLVKGGNWAKLGVLAAGGALTYGGYDIYSSQSARSEALKKLRPYVKNADDRACLDSAVSLSSSETSFDVVAFAVNLLGPLGLEAIKIKMSKPTLSTRAPGGSSLSEHPLAEHPQPEPIAERASQPESSTPHIEAVVPKKNLAKFIDWDKLTPSELSEMVLNNEWPFATKYVGDSDIAVAIDFIPDQVKIEFQQKLKFLKSLKEDLEISKSPELLALIDKRIWAEMKSFQSLTEFMVDKVMKDGNPVFLIGAMVHEISEFRKPFPEKFALDFYAELQQGFLTTRSLANHPYPSIEIGEATRLTVTPEQLSAVDRITASVDSSFESKAISFNDVAMREHLEQRPITGIPKIFEVTPKKVADGDLEVRAKLKAMGIEPKVDPHSQSGFSRATNIDGYSNNYMIRADELPPPKATSKALDPALTNPKMKAAIEDMERRGIHLVVDSSMSVLKNPVGDGSTGAYFLDQGAGQGVIALRPESSWRTFIHEYTHSIFNSDYVGHMKDRALTPRAWDGYLNLPFKQALAQMKLEAPELVLKNEKLMREIFELKQKGYGQRAIDETLATRREQELLASEHYLPILNYDAQISSLSAKRYGIQHRISDLESLQLDLQDQGSDLNSTQMASLASDRLALARLENWEIPLVKLLHRPTEQQVVAASVGAGLMGSALIATAGGGAVYYNQEIAEYIMTFKDGRSLRLSADMVEPPTP